MTQRGELIHHNLNPEPLTASDSLSASQGSAAQSLIQNSTCRVASDSLTACD